MSLPAAAGPPVFTAAAPAADEDRRWSVYQLTFEGAGIYLGQTCRLDQRLAAHRTAGYGSYLRGNRLLWLAYVLCGDGRPHLVSDGIGSQAEALDLEAEMIALTPLHLTLNIKGSRLESDLGLRAWRLGVLTAALDQALTHPPDAAAAARLAESAVDGLRQINPDHRRLLGDRRPQPQHWRRR